MDWNRREGVTASGLKSLRLEPGVVRELPVDDGHDAALGADLCQEFTEDVITETVKVGDQWRGRCGQEFPNC